jgi:protein SCO1/2
MRLPAMLPHPGASSSAGKVRRRLGVGAGMGHRALATAIAGATLLAAAAGCGGGSSGATSPPASTSAQAAPAGGYAAPAQASPARPAPEFALRDSTGKLVHLSDFRGRAVLLTFIYDHCPDVCPLIVGNLHAALEQLGPAASKAQVVAVSVDPIGDTPKTVKAFVAAHGMTGRMTYLIGSKQRLAPVWKRYGVQVQGTPESREGVGHSALVYGITGSGRETTLYPSNMKPAWVAHDVPLLAER